MVLLVRCPDQTVTVALDSRLESLISEGLITEYLGCYGWVATTDKKPNAKPHPVSAGNGRCTAFVSCF